MLANSILANDNNNNNDGNASHANTTNEFELQKLRLAINKVVNLYRRANGRGTGLDETLSEASAKTDIDLRQLLNDCLRFPEVFPHAKNEQGLRKFFLYLQGLPGPRRSVHPRLPVTQAEQIWMEVQAFIPGDNRPLSTVQGTNCDFDMSIYANALFLSDHLSFTEA